MKISVNAGHTPSGMAGCGAVGILNESNETRVLAKKVASLLRANGQDVQLNIINEPNSYNFEDCYERANKSNIWGAELYIDIHLNSAEDGEGTETWICGFGGTAEKYAKQIVDSIANKCGFHNRGVKKAGFIVLNRTNAPAVLIETCFVQDPDASNYNSDLAAKAIAEGILNMQISSTPTIENTVAANEEVITVEVDCDALNVRSGPSTSYSIVDVFKKGRKCTVDVQYSKGDWYSVRWGDHGAFINKNYCKLLGDNAQDNKENIQVIQSVEEKTEVIDIEVTAKCLNVREKADVNSKILGRVWRTHQMKANLAYSTNKWYNVFFGDHGGFVSKEYVKRI